MTDVTIAILLLSVIVVALVAVQVTRYLSRRRWQEHEELEFLTDQGFERVSDRWLIDSRIVRYSGTRHGVVARVESGAGPACTYTRVDIDFPSTIPIGVRISSEHEEGVLTRVLQLREIEIGLRQFDSQFILLSRNEERLKALLDRQVRQMLLRLRREVRDVRVDEDGVHFHTSGEIESVEFLGLLDAAAELARATFRKASEIMEEERQEADTSVFTPIPGELKAVRPEKTP